MKQLLFTQHFIGNEDQAGVLTDFFEKLNTGEAYFLIEVSSDMPYNFNNGNICSCTELAGKDSNVENENINIRDAGIIDFDSGTLSIPYQNKNWYFPLTFPPYVVYGRINEEGQVTVPENCGHAEAHPNFHGAMTKLPSVQ